MDTLNGTLWSQGACIEAVTAEGFVYWTSGQTARTTSPDTADRLPAEDWKPCLGWRTWGPNQRVPD